MTDEHPGDKNSAGQPERATTLAFDIDKEAMASRVNPPDEEITAPTLARKRSAPLLVASDIDGTFVTSAERVSKRLREVITRMLRAGTVLTLASGRPPRWITPVVQQLPVRPMCVCANGAIVYDSATEQIVHAEELAPEVLGEIARIARRCVEKKQEEGQLPAQMGIGFGVERIGADIYSEGDQFLVEPDFDHAWDSTEHTIVSEEELLSVPATKLLVRTKAVRSKDLYKAIAPAIDPAVAHVTYSYGGGLLEVAAPGVNKARGLAAVAELVGVEAGQVAAFGDMPNDREMLQWAGFGVAMGNSSRAVKAVADAVTSTNDDFGVARVLEQWF